MALPNSVHHRINEERNRCGSNWPCDTRLLNVAFTALSCRHLVQCLAAHHRICIPNHLLNCPLYGEFHHNLKPVGRKSIGTYDERILGSYGYLHPSCANNGASAWRSLENSGRRSGTPQGWCWDPCHRILCGSWLFPTYNGDCYRWRPRNNCALWNIL